MDEPNPEILSHPEDMGDQDVAPDDEAAPPGSRAGETPRAAQEIPPPGESRGRRFLRKLARGLLIGLVLLGLGALAATWLLYRPAVAREERVRSELQTANQRIAALEGDVQDLTPAQDKNEALQKELDSAKTHVVLLRCLSDVNASRLALAQKDPASARSLLSKTPEMLKSLAAQVGASQKDSLKAMQDRLALALNELDRDSFAAQSDLEVLANSLIQLENTLFTQP